MKITKVIGIVISFVLFIGCGSKSKDTTLPYLGFHDVVDGDTLYHTTSNFTLMDQDSALVSSQSLKGHVYVADFFFTHCPSICPKVNSQLLRLQDRFSENGELKIISFTLDPKNDTVPRLKYFADKIGADDNWRFLTGHKDSIWNLCESYFSVALEDDEAPGGINHSGKLLLVDRQGRFRSFCEGTITSDVDKFMKDVEILLHHP